MKYCAELGLGLVITHITAVLSVKKAMCEMFGKSLSSSVALAAAIASMAISALKTSACPLRPSFSVSISFPRR